MSRSDQPPKSLQNDQVRVSGLSTKCDRLRLYETGGLPLVARDRFYPFECFVGMDNAKLVRWVKTAGSALAIVSVIFIAALFWKERDVISTFQPSGARLAALAFSALAYGLLGWVLADAWRQLLIWSGESHVSISDTRRIYAQTQIAKYIPGNIAQFAGRQIMGRQAGWTHIGLLLSTIFELLTLVCVGAAITAIGVAAGSYSETNILGSIGVVALLIVASLIFLRIGPRLFIKRWPDTAHRLANLKLSQLWPVAIYHIIFFITSGLLLVLVTTATIGDPLPYERWPALVALFSVAWIISTLTPGAPSGIGVRELVLVAGLMPITATGTAILVATLWRAVTISGDLLFFLVAGLRTIR